MFNKSDNKTMNSNTQIDPNELTIASRNIRRKMNFSGTIQNFNQTTRFQSKSALTFVSKCENCQNWERILLYEKNLKELTDEKEKLTKVNNYLMLTITRKDEIILKLMKENKGFLAEINSLKIQVNNLAKNHFLKNNYESDNSNCSDDSRIISGKEKKRTNSKPRNSNSEQDDFLKRTNFSHKDSIFRTKRNPSLIKRNESLFNTKSVTKNKFSNFKIIDEKGKDEKKEINNVNTINTSISKNIEIIEKKFDNIKRKFMSIIDFSEKNEDQKQDDKKKDIININKLTELSQKLSKIEWFLDSNEKSNVNSSNNIKKDLKIIKKNSLKNFTNNITTQFTNSKISNPKPVEHNISNLKHNFYDKISVISKKQLNRKKEGNVRTSFLSMDEEALKKVPKTELIKEMYNLTLNDVDFIHAMRIFPEDRLISYCEMIGNTIKDFEKAIKVIYRLKNFLRVSNKVYNSMTAEESVKIIIKNACEILDCDRSTIFTYDKYSNNLILHAGEGFNKSDGKFAIDKGIIGLVFKKGERVKLDDAYLDDRFNKEIDKKTNYRTRTILCVPLKDHENNIIGVIQSINKRNGLFTTDDEEIMDIFANQASSILKNSLLNDEYFNFSSRLKYTIDYAIKLSKCNSYYDLSCLSEEVLSYYFSANLSQILFYNKAKNCLVKVNKDQIIEKKCNFGIVGYVFKHKEMIGFNNIDESNYFNKIVDLEIGYPVLTFPILSQEDEILAITQTAYPDRLNTKTNLPKDNDFSLLQYYRNICANWLELNKDLYLS